MKGEHEIKEAEDKVEGARVAAVGAKAEREDWEGRQREALAEMRLDQLKVSATISPSYCLFVCLFLTAWVMYLHIST